MTDVSKILEKGMVTALGATKLFFEIAQDAVKEMIDMGKMAPEEGEHFLDNLSEKIDREKEIIKGRLGEKMHDAVDTVGFATENDIEEIKQHIIKISQRLDDIESLMKRD